MGLANPGGYLTITRDAITGARQIGTGTVDGQPVTNFRVNVDPAKLADVAGLSPEQRKTIVAALAVLQREGFTGNTTDVSVDARGFIVHTRSVNSFADGGSVISDDTFSQFGCAGAVDIPGRPVSTATGACADRQRHADDGAGLVRLERSRDDGAARRSLDLVRARHRRDDTGHRTGSDAHHPEPGAGADHAPGIGRRHDDERTSVAVVADLDQVMVRVEEVHRLAVAV